MTITAPLDTSLTVALFIIPNAVSFPGTKVPLHVFEPRYRTLIKESVRRGHRVAVCHSKKLIAEAKMSAQRPLTPAEILNSNQANYEPQRIFAAGLAEIKDVTADGRLIVEIKMDGRYQIIEELQTLPYRIVRCEPYDDEPGHEDPAKSRLLRESIDAALLRISLNLGDNLREVLNSQAWTSMTTSEFSFRIFQYVRFEPDLMQRVLEMRRPLDRLQLLATALSGAATE